MIQGSVIAETKKGHGCDLLEKSVKPHHLAVYVQDNTALDLTTKEVKGCE